MSQTSSGLTRRAVVGMLWMAWSSGANAVLKVVVLILLTRLLSPADFGVVGAALIVIGFSVTFSQLGLGPALVQRPELERRHISTAFAASVVAGLLVAVAVWVSAPALASFFHMRGFEPVMRALAWMFPIKGISAVAECLAQRDLRFRWLANLEVVTYAVGYGLVGIALALMGWGVWALVAAQLAQAGLKAGVLVWSVPPLITPTPDRRSFRELMAFGGGYTGAQLGVFLANQADNVVVGRWLGPTALGLYSRAYQLMAVPTALFGDVLDNVLFPAMARVQTQSARLASAYLQGTALLSLTMIPVSLMLVVLAPELIGVTLGERWQEIVLPFQILALGMLFRTSYRMSDSLARATGAVYRRAWRQAVYAMLVFAGALVGQRYGVTGVAVGVLGSLFINYLLMAQLGLAVSGSSWRQFVGAQTPAIRVGLAVGGSALAIMVGMRQTQLPAFVRLVLGGAVPLALGAGLVWRWPNAMLGSHGIWMRDLALAQLAGRFRRTPVRPPTDVDVAESSRA